MANSGIAWIDYIYDISVRGLFYWAKLMGITYEEINVWLFCITWPVFTLILIAWSLHLIRQNRQLRGQINA